MPRSPLCAPALLLAVLAGPALADPPQTEPAAPPAASDPASTDDYHPLEPLRRKVPQARGIAIGFDDGVFGDGMEGSLRIKVPFSFLGIGNFGFHVGPVFLMHNTGTDAGPDVFFGGRFYLFGQSPVLANCLRLYGGFGLQVVKSLTNPNEPISVLPYGQDGIEFFMFPSLSFYMEIGLTPLNGKYPITGVAVFGVNFYLTDAG